MSNFSAQPLRNADGELLNPLTGETPLECARRLHREHIQRHEPNPRAAARQQAEACARSNMAQHDPRLLDFYAAVAAYFVDA